MDRKYKVVFFDLIEEKEFFKEKMLILGVSLEVSEEIINRAPVTLKVDASLEYLKKYAKAVSDAGGRVNIRPLKAGNSHDDIINIEPFENFTLCSRCGHKQLKKKVCVKCGYPLKKDK